MNDQASPSSDAARIAWRAAVEKSLGEASFEDVLESSLPGGVRVEALAPDRGAMKDLAGIPGVGSQVRGGSPDLRASACAPLRDEPEAKSLNRSLLADLEGGAPAAHVVLDRGARLGRGGPQESVEARGLLLGTSDTLRDAFRGVLRDAIELSFDCGANALPVLGLLQASEGDGGRGSYELGHDPVAALARDGSLPGEIDAAWDDARQLVEAAERFPFLRALAVDTRPFHEAGADVPLELACLLSSGAELLRALAHRGVSLEAVASQVVLRVALDPDVFPSIALVRAARRLWAQLLASCGVDAPPIRVHAFEGARSLSRTDPWVNILRTTTQAFAAQVAGADTFTPLSYDRALGPPGLLGRRIARNTPAVLALEGHTARVTDPGGGSGHVEALTEAFAHRAWVVFQELEAEGGARRAARARSNAGSRRATRLVARASSPGIPGSSGWPCSRPRRRRSQPLRLRPLPCPVRPASSRPRRGPRAWPSTRWSAWRRVARTSPTSRRRWDEAQPSKRSPYRSAGMPHRSRRRASTP